MNIDAYFDRIALPQQRRRALRPDLAGLRELTRLHPQAIAFENLNPLMRLPVPLDLVALEAKLVHGQRGGFCFEQNALFAAVLEQLGFSVRRLAARVVWGQDDTARAQNPRTHMVLLVDLGAQDYLCDVGFGGITPTAPLRVSDPAEQATPHEPFRVLERGETLLLQAGVGGQWRDVYLFDRQQQEPADYEMANHFVCSFPASHFRSTLIAARPFDGGRYALRNFVLTTYRTNGPAEERFVNNADELAGVLERTFGVVVPDQAMFRDAVANHVRPAAESS